LERRIVDWEGIPADTALTSAFKIATLPNILRFLNLCYPIGCCRKVRIEAEDVISGIRVETAKYNVLNLNPRFCQHTSNRVDTKPIV
jgi:hypothetical protein